LQTEREPASGGHDFLQLCSNEIHAMGGLFVSGVPKAIEDIAPSRPFPGNSELNVVSLY
jgi:hypothetical protein